MEGVDTGGDPPGGSVTLGGHQHGMDCCWDCYLGNHVHPRGPDDPECVGRADGDGVCWYGRGPKVTDEVLLRWR